MSLPDLDPADARQQLRDETLKGALILSGRDRAPLHCLVTNMSADGAELSLAAGVRAPQQFVLHVPQEERAYRAQVRWREEGRIGVVFTGCEHRPKPAPAVAAI